MPDFLKAAEELPDPPPTISFRGQVFTLAETSNPGVLMEYASKLNNGVHPESLEGLGALWDVIETNVSAEDWPRMRQVIRNERVGGDELLELTSRILQVFADRPTGRPSGFSDGRENTEVRSEGDSVSRAKERFEQKGRPDQAAFLMVVSEQTA